MKKLWIALLAACLLTLQVSAHDVPDLSRRGSITISVRYNGKPVSGGEMILYRVGDIREENGNYRFVPVPDFEGSKISLDAPQSADTAQKLAGYARKQGYSGVHRDIDDDGIASYDALEPGLYLLMQKKPAQGYQAISPFLVSLPMLVGDTYQYDVDAGPKVSPVPVKPSTESPGTGQSGWPIWVFVMSAAGLLILSRRRKI